MSIAGLIGELTSSAFAGLIAFWLCEAMDVNPLVTAAVTGMAGHAGSNALLWLEKLGKKYVFKRFGVDERDSDHAPLEKP